MIARPTIDWNAFLARLTGTAIGWMAGRRTGLINAKDAADLAMNAAVDVFEKYHQTGPAKTEDELYAIAFRAMWHDFLDQIKSGANRTNIPMEEYEMENAGHSVGGLEDEVLERIEVERVRQKYYSLAQGEQELIDYMDAVLELKVYKREDAADLLGVSRDDITNMQKKLRYRRDRSLKKASNQPKEK